MAKIDLTQTKEANTINTRSAKKIQHEKAIEVLDKAKRLNRKVVFLKQGECQYSRELKFDDSQEDLLISRSAAAYLMISYSAFSRRLIKLKIPFIKKRGNNKFYRISDLDKYKNQILNA